MQVGARVLDLSTRDAHPAYLVCADLGRVGAGRSSSLDEVLFRQMANHMRDLFPDYGVYEVLGRVSTNEFFALTTSEDRASRSAFMLRARNAEQLHDGASDLAVRVGIAYFNPRHPLTIDELLANARRATRAHARMAAANSAGSARGVTRY